MFTCFIQYTVDPNKLSEFREYAKAWIHLIEKYGGTHHGYFIPGDSQDEFPDASFSFPGLGENGPNDIAIALFSFPDIAAYESYRRDVAHDDECVRATMRFNETRCFSRYQRTFLKPVFK